MSKLHKVLMIEMDTLFKMIFYNHSLVATLNIINLQGKVQMKTTIINCTWKHVLSQRY